MHAIVCRPFGYQVLLAGHVDAVEMSRWLDSAHQALVTAQREFGLILDLRGLAPLAPDARRILARGLQLYQQRGMHRSAVIVLGNSVKNEFTRLARESGIYHWERYLSSEERPDWLALAEAWVRQGVDPDDEANQPSLSR
jgi:hypothetical protein